MSAPFSIPISGLAASDPVPGNYIDLNFAQGASSIGTNTYPILLIGNKSTAGVATTNTVIYGGPNSPLPLQTTQDAITLFGQGSELHRMFKRVVAVNTATPIYAIAVTESAGTAATGVVTYATTATANGNVRTWIGDTFVDTAITNGDTPTVVATNVAASVNANPDFPCTASNALGVLTLTAKIKGPRGNWIRFASVITGTGVGTTSTATAPAFFTSGATADTNVTALSTILPYRYYYIVSAAEDATQLGALVTQVNSQAAAITGIRQRVFAGSVDTSGSITTIATGVNAARAEVIWCQNSEVPPAEMAASWAAIIALEEAPVAFTRNFDGYGNDAVTSTRWTMKAPRDGTAPTRATIKAALNNGITPVGVNANGSTYVVSRITTRSLNGSTNDYRIRDAHKVTICDRYADDLYNKFVANFSRKLIADDPAPGQRVPGNQVVTPRVALAAINKLTADYDALDMLQNTFSNANGGPAIVPNTICIREAAPTTRLTARIPLQPIDALHQVGFAIDQVAAFAVMFLSLAALIGQHFLA